MVRQSLVAYINEKRGFGFLISPSQDKKKKIELTISLVWDLFLNSNFFVKHALRIKNDGNYKTRRRFYDEYCIETSSDFFLIFLLNTVYRYNLPLPSILLRRDVF